MEEYELAQVEARIGDAIAALKRVEGRGNEALELAINRRLILLLEEKKLLLEEKKRRAAGTTITYSMRLFRPIPIRLYPCDQHPHMKLNHCPL